MIPSEAWIDADKTLPKEFSGTFRVKRKNGVEMEAHYYSDAMAWIAYYGRKTSHWWDANGNHDRLDDVISWMPLPNPPPKHNEDL